MVHFTKNKLVSAALMATLFAAGKNIETVF
jgi:hypothetical protein